MIYFESCIFAEVYGYRIQNKKLFGPSFEFLHQTTTVFYLHGQHQVPIQISMQMQDFLVRVQIQMKNKRMFCNYLASSIGNAKHSRIFSWLFNVAQLGLRIGLVWPILSSGLLAEGRYLELGGPVWSCVSSIWSPRKLASFWHHYFLLWKSRIEAS